MSRKIKSNKKVLSVFLLWFYILLAFSPIFWTFNTSLKQTKDVYNIPPLWFPEPTLKNYIEVFSTRPFFQYTVNTIFISLSVTLICVTIGALAAYGFSTFKENKIVKYLFIFIIGSRMIPPVCLVTPFAILFSIVKLVDTKLALIIACTSFQLPFAIWIMKNSFDAISPELENAARIDGCDRINCFTRVSIPIARTGIVAAGLISFLLTWNEFVFAALLTRTNVSKTLPIGITDFFMDDYIRWNLLAASTIFVIIPALIFVSFFQKYIVSGMMSGSLKG